MKNNKPPSFYIQEIESAASTLATASQRFAEAALQHALSQKPEGVGLSATKGARPSPCKISVRRSPEEMVRLCDALEAAVESQPGSAIRELAAAIESTPAALSSVVSRLKYEKRIHKIGTLQHTRYFPGNLRNKEAKPAKDSVAGLGTRL